MKTVKEVARELGVKYIDLIGFLKIIGIKPLFGVYRLTEKQIDRIKRIRRYENKKT